MELYVDVLNRNEFINDFILFIKELAEDGDVIIKREKDWIYVGYKNMYMYIDMSDYEGYCRSVEKTFNVTVNVSIDLELYHKIYEAGLKDIAKITKKILDVYDGDYVLLDECTAVVIIRRDGVVTRGDHTDREFFRLFDGDL